MDDKTLKEEMIREALTILGSVDWLEQQIHHQLALLEEAQNNNLYEEIELIRQQIHTLIKKLDRENRNMDDFMLKYSTIIKYEKEAILSDFKQKKQSYLRSISQNQRRTSQSKKIQSVP